MIEPGIAMYVGEYTGVDWHNFLACPTCRVRRAEPCRSVSGTITNGRPDSISVALTHPHAKRRRSARAAGPGGTRA